MGVELVLGDFNDDGSESHEDSTDDEEAVLGGVGGLVVSTRQGWRGESRGVNKRADSRKQQQRNR